MRARALVPWPPGVVQLRVLAEQDLSRARVLLLEPNAALRSAVETVLGAESYEVETYESLEQLLLHAEDSTRVVALVAWQSMQGLLAEEHRHQLIELTRNLRLMIMVPRRWVRLLEGTDLGVAVAGIIAKPFGADELLASLEEVVGPPMLASQRAASVAAQHAEVR